MAIIERRYDIDWLRSGAVLLLIPFHAALVFVQNPDSIVYLKDKLHSSFLENAALFVHVWHMPLLFFLAGAAAWYSLQSKTGKDFLIDRVKRLFIPLIFALITIIPSMTYITALSRNTNISFKEHYIHFFTSITDLTGIDGSLTPAHLWFLLFLFIFSAAALPMFLYYRNNAALRHRLGTLFNRVWFLFILVIPLLLISAIPLMGDKNPFYYLALFILGFVLNAEVRIMETIRRNWFIFLFIGMGTMGVFYLTPYKNLAHGLLFQISRWMLLLAILGAGRLYLNKKSAVLSYLSKASYTVYIVHLPLLTLMSLLIIQLNFGISIKYIFIVFSTLLSSLFFYEIIKRIPYVRFFFGIKETRKR